MKAQSGTGGIFSPILNVCTRRR